MGGGSEHICRYSTTRPYRKGQASFFHKNFQPILVTSIADHQTHHRPFVIENEPAAVEKRNTMRLNPFFGWSQMSSAARALRIVIGVSVAAFAVWTLSPLFYSRQVNEQFPS